MIVKDYEANAFVVFIDGEPIKQFEDKVDAETFERYKLQGRKDKTRRKDVAYLLDAQKLDITKDIRKFANDYLLPDDSNILLKDDLFALYQRTGGRLHRVAFFRTLKQVVSKRGLLISLQIMRKGERKCYIKGVRLK